MMTSKMNIPASALITYVKSSGFSSLISVMTQTALAHSRNKVVKLNFQIYQFNSVFRALKVICVELITQTQRSLRYLCAWL